MSKYYKSVGVPQTQFRQSKAPSGPTVDVNARQEIENERANSLGSAITNFIGIGASVAQTTAEYKDREKRRVLSANKLKLDEIQTDITANFEKSVTAELGDSFGTADLKKVAEARDKVWADYISKYKNEEYSPFLEETLGTTKSVLYRKFSEKNERRFTQKAVTNSLSSINKIMSSNELDDKNKIDLINDQVEGLLSLSDTDLEDLVVPNKEQLVTEFLSQAFSQGIKNDNMIFTEMLLNSPVVKEELKNVEGIDDLKKITKQKAFQQRNIAIKNSEQSMDMQMSQAVTAFGITSVDNFSNYYEQLVANIPAAFRPDAKFKKDLTEKYFGDIEDQKLYQQLRPSLDKGDTTVLKLNDLTGKKADAMLNKHAMSVLNIDTLDRDSVFNLTTSGDRDIQLKSLYTSGIVPPAIREAMNTISSGYEEVNGVRVHRMQKHYNALMATKDLIKGTGLSVTDFVTPETHAQVMFFGETMELANNGAITKEAAQQRLESFQLSFNKDRDSRGLYVNKDAQKFIKTDEHSKWMDDAVDSQSFFNIGDNVFPEYARATLNHYFNLEMLNTNDPDLARSRASEAFEKMHVTVELPSGDDVKVRKEFGDNLETYLDVAKSLPNISNYFEITALGKTTFDSDRVSFGPTPDGRGVQFYVDDMPLSSVSLKDWRKRVEMINKAKKAYTERQFTKKMEKLKQE